MKALDEYFIMVLVLLLLKRVHFLSFCTILRTENMTLKWLNDAGIKWGTGPKPKPNEPPKLT